MSDARRPTSAASRPSTRAPARRSGFTLTEVLIVIGLILLVITIAIPVMSALSGGRSVDAAQNQIAAALGRARQDAMAMQEPRGIVIFPDENSGRAVVAEVYYVDFRNNSPLLELLPDREELELPVGIGCQVMPRGNGSAPSDTTPTPPLPAIGVIMFDGFGKVSIRPYVIEAHKDSRGNDNRLAARLGQLPPLPTPPNPPLGRLGTSASDPGITVTTQVGALLYDRTTYDELPEGAARYTWLKDNATPVLLNRYNGALLPNNR